ncbi:MAG TPA: 16S rRNA (guanine(527)-N(7))-methyltransferase RsmG [Candidatus Acidoferrum sp.]|nr:16S rRNA (guanine(527)-N(7))-methyltransferase RsmG [Candidatus Acidoferrum sp.]
MLTNTAAPLSADLITKALREFQLEATPAQVAAIQRYMAILLAWNEKINLTAIRDPLEVLYRHFCESMYAAAAVPLQTGRLADVGSGGGFPGLALKIACSELQVVLIESNVKKATFLAEVVRELGFRDTRVLVSRYEELGEEIAPLNFVCSRALGEFATFLSWARSERVAAERVILWVGGRDMEEVKKISGWSWEEPIAIPHSLQRFLLVGVQEGKP